VSDPPTTSSDPRLRSAVNGWFKLYAAR
jgi:hypothetical protein